MHMHSIDLVNIYLAVAFLLGSSDTADNDIGCIIVACRFRAMHQQAEQCYHEQLSVRQVGTLAKDQADSPGP